MIPYIYYTHTSLMIRLFFTITTLLLLGVGCTTPPPVVTLPITPPAPNTNSATVPAPNKQPKNQAFYIAYSQKEFDRVFTERPIVLYFWASWCPICRAEEPKIQALIERSELAVTGFRVNFDTETALKEKYRVPYQHTTIILNLRGEESARFTGPVSDVDLAEAISNAGL